MTMRHPKALLGSGSESPFTGTTLKTTKLFTCILVFNPYNNPVRKNVISPLYRQENFLVKETDIIEMAIQINLNGITYLWIYDSIKQRKWAWSGRSGYVSLKR